MLSLPANEWPLLLRGLLALALIALAAIDWRSRRVPSAVCYALAVATVIAALTGPGAPGAAAGGLLCLGLGIAGYALGRLRYASEALGKGDIAIATFVGTIAGVSTAPLALVIGVLANAAAGLWNLASGRLSLRGSTPFGAALCLGGLIVVLRP